MAATTRGECATGAFAAGKETRFDWPLCYEAEKLVQTRISAFLDRNSAARGLSRRMIEETGTRLLDWIDHLTVPPKDDASFRAVGFVPDPSGETPPHQRALWHPEAMLPRVVVDENVSVGTFPAAVALHPDSLAEFLAVHGVDTEPEGAPLTRFRRARIAVEGDARLEAVERRGYRGYVPAPPRPGGVEQTLQAMEIWQTRRRQFDTDEAGFQQTHQILDRLVSALGPDMACHVVFLGERAYWQRRNRAAQIQKARQDVLGLGWGNHDHHTFRSSRRHFVDLMRALETLGFERRERYYAGGQAGWGAQILEQPVEGIVAFCDVDLLPSETEIDFSRQPLPAAGRLGTIGLWVGLHGESLLQAGMHHLECRFDFELLREQLARENVATMKPFSDFPFLRQAFTAAQQWPVNTDRAERLLSSGLITREQFDRFVAEGALGSHLENLQREGGFKGFNQKSVSVIIQATDPRSQ